MKNQILLSVVFSLVVTSSIAMATSAQGAASTDSVAAGQAQNPAVNAKKKAVPAKTVSGKSIGTKAGAVKAATAKAVTANAGIVSTKLTKVTGVKPAAVATTKASSKTKTAVKTTSAKVAAVAAAQKSPVNDTTSAANQPVSPAFSAGLNTSPLATASAPVLKTQVTQPTTQTKKNPWSIKYISVNSLDLNAIENASPTGDQSEVTAWDRLGVSYNFNPDIAASLVVQTNHTWFGNQDRVQDRDNPGLLQPGSFYWGDVYAAIAHNKLVDLGKGFTVSGWTRWYFPTSEVSQKADQIGMSWTDITLNKSVGIVDLKLHEQPRVYFQRYTTSSLFDAAGKPEPLYDYRWYHLLEQDVNVSSKWSFAFTEGLELLHKYADTNINPTTGLPTPEKYGSLIILNPEIDYSLNKIWSFALGVWEETSLNDSYHPFDAARGDDVSAYFVVNIAI